MSIQPEGIKDLEPRDPVGAVLSIGIRDERGIPRQKDRFHLLLPRASEGEGRYLRRAAHPAFRSFNAAQPERRQVVQGALVHNTRTEAFEHHLKAQKITGLRPSHNRHACIGDGKTAQRWDTDRDGYAEIQCPHEKCQYRLTTPVSCKPFMRLLFRIIWSGTTQLPSMLVKYTSGSWNTTRNALGLFEELDRAAQAMGLKRFGLYGYPFTMTLLQQTSAEKKARFPVVHFSATESPEQFFLAQKKRLADLGGKYASLEHMRDSGEVYEDTREIAFPGEA